MTCIVGVEHAGGVTIGGDAAASSDNLTGCRVGSKVFRVGPYLIGYTSSFRMGDLLRYALQPPAPKTPKHLDRQMVTEFIDSVRECLKDGGYARTTDQQESAGEFLVAVTGRLYEIGSDYQVGRPLEGYTAIGSGSLLAIGSLATTADSKLTPRQRAVAALNASARHDPFVNPPFTVKTVQ